ncbi:DNA-3-methyladenine glycosylase family protein [Halococcoides cellulosivorans]|uniref:DNA-(apurinic or apyrimidinic site) lyase n=1 Tax=Halococcoides cellulosivorans TaxID=1679096 RepID=A0A2R4WXR7_9EURY|nr:8-oxoguanine DNA glycosylase [Halococcoides cellulosivorans]AWB26310.1 8-oxoguanine DNA glycosylase [Halococcoides cellulosivorans]
MHTGTIDPATIPGGIDLGLTLESGQSYLWTRADGDGYTGDPDGSQWYTTVTRAAGAPPGGESREGDPRVLQVRERPDGGLDWRATMPAAALVRERLRLDDDLDAIAARAPSDPVIGAAFDAHRGLRLIDDPAYPTLIAFICSTQMRVARIHGMVTDLRRDLGDPVEFDGATVHAFPTPERLAAAGEDRLRELGLGYRAPYVAETARMVADGTHPADAAGMQYEDAREWLTRFVGVGDKVADCVALFALGFDEAVPLDTWIQTAIEERFPDCDRDSYAETSRALRDRLGPDAGYVQTYLFHHLRTAEAATAD